MGSPPSPAQATKASLGGTGLSGNPPITPKPLDWKQRSQDPEEEEPVSVLRAGPVGEPPTPKGTPVLMTVLLGSLYPHQEANNVYLQFRRTQYGNSGSQITLQGLVLTWGPAGRPKAQGRRVDNAEKVQAQGGNLPWGGQGPLRAETQDVPPCPWGCQEPLSPTGCFLL